jgi:methyl-accepting chemotaxis protein
MVTKTKSINDIVLKTQICSFNASVEAARAGQYGKGFSIVADEVGRLAKITGLAAKEIDDLIKKSRSALQKALSAIFESVHSADEVNKTVSKNYTSFLDNIIHVHTSLDNVGKASAEQIQGLNQISKAIEQIEHASQESRQMAENINNLVRHLSTELSAPQKNNEPNVADLVNSIAQKSTEPPIALGADLQNISADDPSFKIRE